MFLISIFALLSAAPPYLPLYYYDVLGFSSNQIGVILAIAPFIQSIACPLWTYISITGSLDGLFWVFGAFSCFTNLSTAENQLIVPELDGLEQVPTNTIISSRRLINAANGNRVPVNNYNSINSNSHYVDLSKPNSIASAHTIREEADETLNAIGGVDLGLAISRIASIDQSMSRFIDVTSEGIPSPDIFKSARVLTFLITTLLFGFVLSMIVNFLFLFLSRDLQIPISWIGWTGPTTGVTELLCFSKQLTEIFGVTNMILVAHIATIIRCLIYTILTPDSFITNVSALSLQTLHGIGFGIFWATAVSEIEQRSVAQGILGALHFGLGAGLGVLTGGYLYGYMGTWVQFGCFELPL